MQTQVSSKTIWLFLERLLGYAGIERSDTKDSKYFVGFEIGYSGSNNKYFYRFTLYNWIK